MLLDNLVPLMIRNDSGQTIPPFGCVQINADVIVSGSDIIFPVTRPTSAVVNQGNATRFLFNGDNEIPNGGFGAAYAVSPMAFAAIDEDAGISTVDNWKQFCGPVSGSFILGAGFYFEAIAKADAADINTTEDSQVCIIQPRVQTTFVGVATSAITTASGGTVEVKGFNGTNGFNVAGEELDVVTIAGDIEEDANVIGFLTNNAAVVVEVCS